MTEEEFNLQKTKGRKFSLIKNLGHSLRGVAEVTKNEKPMQVEVALFFLGTFFILFIDMGTLHKIILFISLLFPIYAELVNSSIERVVDLVTSDYHELAKNAKDAASAVVLLSLVITGFIWVATLYHYYIGF